MVTGFTPDEEINHRVTHLGCGTTHCVCRLDTGLVLSLGQGEDGKLGHSHGKSCATPSVISELMDTAIRDVTCGEEHSIAISEEGQLYSWGVGASGRLGHRNAKDVDIPWPVHALSTYTIRQVACGGGHTLLVTSAGNVFSFGANGHGQLGHGTRYDDAYPRPVEALKEIDVTSIAAGKDHSLVATKDGELYAWGAGDLGNLGNGFGLEYLTPTMVRELDHVCFKSVCCGQWYSSAIDKYGIIYTFGLNMYGQLGNGNNEYCGANWESWLMSDARRQMAQPLHEPPRDQPRPTPITIPEHKRMAILGCGWCHTIAADADGNLYGWGHNEFGQLGLGHNENANSPQHITKLAGKKVVLVSCGALHSFGVTDKEEVYSWGFGGLGQLGHGDRRHWNTPKLLEDLSHPILDPEKLRRTAKRSSSQNPEVNDLDPVPNVPDRDMPENPSSKNTAANNCLVP